MLGASLLASGAVAVISALGAALLTVRITPRGTRFMINLAVGLLLGVVFLELLPEAIEHASGAKAVFLTVLAGVLVFLLLEKLALWRHAHTEGDAQGNEGTHPAGKMILLGDGFHNAIDGVLIAAAFVADFWIGVVTATAILAHELPQKLANHLVLLHSGHSRSAALLLNLGCAALAVPGALVGYVAFQQAEALLPYALALAAASFIYIAMTDLIPETHRVTEGRAVFQQVGATVVGVVSIGLIEMFLHP